MIDVGFVPKGPGPRHATLRVVTSAGATEVSLDGSGELWAQRLGSRRGLRRPTRPDEQLQLPTSFSWGGPYEFASGAYGDEGVVWRARFDLPGAATVLAWLGFGPNRCAALVALLAGSRRYRQTASTTACSRRCVPPQNSGTLWSCRQLSVAGSPCSLASFSRKANLRVLPVGPGLEVAKAPVAMPVALLIRRTVAVPDRGRVPVQRVP